MERRIVGGIRGQELIGLWSHETGTTLFPMSKFGRWHQGRIRLMLDRTTTHSRVHNISADEPTEPWVCQKRIIFNSRAQTIESLILLPDKQPGRHKYRKNVSGDPQSLVEEKG